MSVIDKEYEAKMGLGPHTEKQGKKMLGAEAIIASLEAEGVDTVFGYPVKLLRSMMPCTIRRRSTMFLLAMSRVRLMKLMAMPVPRVKPVLSS